MCFTKKAFLNSTFILDFKLSPCSVCRMLSRRQVITQKKAHNRHLLLLSQKTSANYIVLKVNFCEISTLALYSIKGGEFVQQLVVKFS